MHLKWKNAFGKISAAAVFMATAGLHAIPHSACDVKPEVCCDDPKPGPFAFAYPFDMDLNCPRDFYFYADFLAMQAKQDGMEFAMEKSNGYTIGGPQTSLTNGTIKGFSSNNSDWGYNFGARIGMGIYLSHDAWNLDFDWTWLNVHEYQRANASTGGAVIIPLQALGADTDPQFFGPRSSAKWNAGYNTVDVTLGKPFYVSRYFIVNPHFGVRGAWIDQEFSVDYGGFAGSTYRLIQRTHNNFWGVGARAGIDTDWLIGKGFCLFGNAATAMLFGKFDVEQHLATPVTGAATGHTVNVGFDVSSDHYMNVPNFDIALGVGWGQYFNKMKYHVGLRVAYEFHVWYDQLNIRKFTGIGQGTIGNELNTQVSNYPNDATSRGNFTLNGFSLALRFDM